MAFPDFAQRNRRLLRVAALVIVTLMLIAVNRASGGKLPIDPALTVSGILKQLAFYGAVLGFIAISRKRT